MPYQPPRDPRVYNVMADIRRRRREQGGGDTRNFMNDVPVWAVLGGLVAYEVYRAGRGKKR